MVTKQLADYAFYMDDLVHFFLNTNESSRILVSVKEALQKGGFNFTKFVSNDINFPDGPLKYHTVQSLHPQRVSGVLWDYHEDKLLMKMDMTNSTDESIFTLRKRLSLIASVFDPLGFVAPAVVTLKIFLLEIWRTGVSWDELLPITFQKQIQKRLHESSKCNRVSLPRCMQVLPTNSKTELHIFTHRNWRSEL